MEEEDGELLDLMNKLPNHRYDEDGPLETSQNFSPMQVGGGIQRKDPHRSVQQQK